MLTIFKVLPIAFSHQIRLFFIVPNFFWVQWKKVQPKNFFWVQTRRLATSFDTSTRSVELTGPEKFLHETTCISVFFWKSPQAARCQSVNTRRSNQAMTTSSVQVYGGLERLFNKWQHAHTSINLRELNFCFKKGSDWGFDIFQLLLLNLMAKDRPTAKTTCQWSDSRILCRPSTSLLNLFVV